MRSIAFPSISKGAYGFPLERATRIAIRESGAFLARDSSLSRLVFVCFGRNAYEVYQQFQSRPE